MSAQGSVWAIGVSVRIWTLRSAQQAGNRVMNLRLDRDQCGIQRLGVEHLIQIRVRVRAQSCRRQTRAFSASISHTARPSLYRSERIGRTARCALARPPRPMTPAFKIDMQSVPPVTPVAKEKKALERAPRVVSPYPSLRAGYRSFAAASFSISTNLGLVAIFRQPERGLSRFW